MPRSLSDFLREVKVSYCFTCLSRVFSDPPQQQILSALDAGEPVRVAVGVCAVCGDRRTVVSCVA